MTRGTSDSIRNALEFETTAHPAAANCGSISFAIEASSAAKIIFGAPFGVAGDTFICATRLGIAVFNRQRAASAYGRPSERSDAASQEISNHGWFSNNWINRCPTMPVAPRIPTESLFGMAKLRFYIRAISQENCRLGHRGPRSFRCESQSRVRRT